MLLDAAEVDDGATIDADLCIVGAGVAGLTVARELSGRGKRIVVLESGATGPEDEPQALAEGAYLAEEVTDLLGTRTVPMDALRLRRLGGTANHWGGYCRPIDPIVFGDRSWVDATGWPIERADLDPYYDRAATALFLPGPDFDVDAWRQALGLPPALVDEPGFTTRLFQKLAGSEVGAAYQRLAAALPDVQVVTHATATELVASEPNADHVEAARGAGFDGRAFTVRATTFVLASGGIDSPRLLLASDAVNPDGLGNDHDQVGRHFCEHLVAAVGFAVLTRPTAEADLYRLNDARPAGAPGGLPAAAVKGIVTPTNDTARAHELLDWEAQIDPGELPLNAPTQTGGLVDVPDVLPLLDAVEGRPGQTVLYLQVNGEQVPKTDSRVVLSDERDALGQRRADLHWTISEQERASIWQASQLLAARWAEAGLGRVQLAPGGFSDEGEQREGGELFVVFSIDPNATDPESFPVGVGFHHMGTLRMATRPEDGVVDADCRVHGVDNLYVAGSAVFPTTGAATPTFTIAALAIRLADHLASGPLA